MSNFIIKFVFTIFIIYGFGNLVPGVEIGSISSLVLFLIFLGVLNGLVLPLIKLVAFPINFLTLGIFNIFLNLFGLFVALSTIEDAIIISEGGFAYVVTLVVLSMVLSVPSYLFDR